MLRLSQKDSAAHLIWVDPSVFLPNHTFLKFSIGMKCRKSTKINHLIYNLSSILFFSYSMKALSSNKVSCHSNEKVQQSCSAVLRVHFYIAFAFDSASGAFSLAGIGVAGGAGASILVPRKSRTFLGHRGEFKVGGSCNCCSEAGATQSTTDTRTTSSPRDILPFGPPVAK